MVLGMELFFVTENKGTHMQILVYVLYKLKITALKITFSRCYKYSFRRQENSNL